MVKGEFNGSSQSNTLVVCKTPQKHQSGKKSWEFSKSKATEVLVFEEMQPFIPIKSAVIQVNLKVKPTNKYTAEEHKEIHCLLNPEEHLAADCRVLQGYAGCGLVGLC